MADSRLAGLPTDALVLLVGPSGAGKSTWAAAHFAGSEILSSDAFRELVAGDPADQSATGDAFKVLHQVAQARLRRGLRTVVDATNLTVGARRSLLRRAAHAGRPAIAVVFDVSLERCLRQNATREDRSVPEAVIHQQHSALRNTVERLPAEGFVGIVQVRDADIDAP